VRRVTAIAIGERRLPLLAASIERIRPRLRAGELLRLLADARSREWALGALPARARLAGSWKRGGALVSLRRAVKLDTDFTRAPFALARTYAAKRTLCAQPAVRARSSSAARGVAREPR